jgi:protoheme IX farnesyltransferase
VTSGPKTTRTHILVYTLLLTPLGFAPVLTGLGGMFYAAVALLGGLAFIALAIKLARSQAGEKLGARADAPAKTLFFFSIFYLFALFAALLLERVIAGLL